MATLNNFRIGRVTDVPFRYLKNKKCQSKIVRPWLAMNIFCILPIQDLERHEFIQFCRSYCQERDWLDEAFEFERQYRSDEAIQWYTRPSGFPSKLINTICRTQNPTLVSKIRYFLKNIDEQLTRLYLESLVWIPNSITIYRGQTFSLKDFKRLVRSNGKKIFTTTPLSTTGSSEVAVIFSGSNTSSHESSENIISVVFKIIIETKTTRSKPFAYIQEYSHIKDEKEILVSIGTIFSCVNIRKRDVNSYEILLIHGRDEEEIENELMRTVIESYEHRRDITVIDFLTSMNIHTTLLDDFHRRSLSSLLDRIASNIINEVPLQFPFTSEENPATNATHDHLVIWLDRHICERDVHIDLKETLSNAINITIDEPLARHEIDRLIQNNNVYPRTIDHLIAVTTMEQCLAVINKHYHKKIFLITSGSIGQDLVPRVREQYPYVENIFVFCSNIRSYVDWALDFTDNLLIFNFHNDLLSRVVYDIGMYYMQKGIVFSDSDDYPRALYYFYIAKKLVMRANFIFQPYFPFSLTTIEQFIMKEEARLPRDMIQSILTNLSYR